MIFFWMGRNSPLSNSRGVLFRAGDIVFLAGRTDSRARLPLPYEHVALVAGGGWVRSVADLRTIPVVGLPEIQKGMRRPTDVVTFDLWMRDAEAATYWKSHLTGWNLAGHIGRDRADDLGVRVSVLITQDIRDNMGEFKYNNRFRIGRNTNCLGFVAYAYQLADGMSGGRFRLFNLKKFRKFHYREPYRYRTGTRNVPAPGHLAHALDVFSSQIDYPYGPQCRSEARCRARAQQTLARKQGVKRPLIVPI